LIHSEDDGVYALAILHEEHPKATTPLTQAPISPTIPVENSIPEYPDERLISGTLESLGENYWVVSGQVIYIVDETHIAEGIKLGNSIRVDYQVEQNGSLTAIEINISENTETNNESDVEGTPESEGSEEIPESTIVINADADEHEGTTDTSEGSETPEPTESENTLINLLLQCISVYY
jgi:hypothetical protein